MLPPRFAAAAAAIFAGLLTGCAPAGTASDATTVVTIGATTTTTPVWVGTPDEAEWWAVDAICHEANDVALADAIDVLTLSTTPDPRDLADYYRRRADQVDALLEQFAEVTPPADTADDWPTVLAGLADYAEWARGIAAEVAADGLEVDQTPDPGLEAFRTLMRYGACNVLLDVN
jgi:hypothetical protein